MVEYEVKRGDTLSAIELKYGVPMKLICECNNIKNPNKIYAGQVLTIPVKETTRALASFTQLVINTIPTFIKNPGTRTATSILGGNVNTFIAVFTSRSKVELICSTLWAIVSSRLGVYCEPLAWPLLVFDTYQFLDELTTVETNTFFSLIDNTVKNKNNADYLKILFLGIRQMEMEH
ncbi:LysM-domain-containing protein [Anaeromyces robustus]|uniref:LysM-domain-containing protein n=1 Tax=Anaeromyces robustus TaxID=1754192 RepID=A0A1Y1XPB3_9FUNG|nr:LysM-domain-containing protein [Anaeromyces robustus]|eukprot:ORX87572.1 LysM-domain-containing protein [Anaeromyces robustus]